MKRGFFIGVVFLAVMGWLVLTHGPVFSDGGHADQPPARDQETEKTHPEPGKHDADDHGSEGAEAIRLSPEAKKNIGLRTEPVRLRTIERILKINGIVKPQPNRIANVSSQIEGMVEEIDIHPGDQVIQGQPLVVIRSLQYGNPPPQVVLHAPISGFVSGWDVRVGEYVDPSKVLFEIVDLASVWVEGDVPEEYAGNVREGQSVRVRAVAYSDRVFEGRIVRASAVVEPEKRVVHRWVEVKNPRLELKPEMFVDLAIVVGTGDRTLSVPRSAILRQGVETFVYVQKGDVFSKRNVEVGIQDDRHVGISRGLSSGEIVVAEGGYELMSSIILKGAGGHGH
ncbi:MAG: efflux RND transporter periplasmic adaptor subunit [Nitrospirae bacterium]|nr:efflux RND transporter periplasmic adaptor subunit [Nitrospirota bacterium]